MNAAIKTCPSPISGFKIPRPVEIRLPQRLSDVPRAGVVTADQTGLKHLDSVFLQLSVTERQLAGENGRDVVLPSGNWHDFWTGRLMNGNQKLHVDRSQREIPVYIRENAVMPWAEPAASTGDPKARRVRVRMYGNGSLAWRGQGEDLQGMLLSADANTSVTEVANAPRPYTITAWDHIG